ncbi:uncharacterized protein LOC109418287 isoform X2 [Aedes albopictus]
MEKVSVSLGQVLDYVGDSVRPLREGQNVFDSGHIVCIGFNQKTPDYLRLAAYVLQSSHPSDIPHELELKIGTDYRKWLLKCSCKAGTARCKHIVACLLHLCQFRFVEYMTCTDSRQAWGRSKAEITQWRAKPVLQLCCVRKHPPVCSSEAPNKRELLQQEFNRILRASPNSAIQKHITGRELSVPLPIAGPLNQPDVNVYVTRNELYELMMSVEQISNIAEFDTDSIKHFYEKTVEKDDQTILDIAEETKDQRNDAWYLHRSIRITASSCYDLFTYTRNKNADWDRKIQQYLNPKLIRSKALDYGKQTEQLALDCYMAKRNPLVKKSGFVVCLKEPWIGVSPDGIDASCNLLIEIKCPVSGEEHDLQWILDNCKATNVYLKKQESSLSLNKNHKYYAQVQLSMYVLGCNMCDFIVYSKLANDFLVVEIQFNEEYVRSLIGALKLVYFQFMLPQIVKKHQGDSV